jgi:UDP-glucose 4-epimerase
MYWQQGRSKKKRVHMRILVTGGAGFIASHVVDAYVAANHEVVVLDNLSTGQTTNVNPRATLEVADITDAEQVEKLIAQYQPEVINHHAAHIQVGNSVKDPVFDARSNVLGVINVMQAAQQHGVKKVVMASTGGAMYGDQPVPFHELLWPEPLSPYGVSKRSGELYLHYYWKQYGIPYVVLRYSNVYGPRQNPHGESGVIAIFSEMIAQGKKPVVNGDGTHTRDYVYVSDVVNANVRALALSHCDILNIGTGIETSTNQVFDAVVQEFGSNIPRVHGAERPGEQVRSVLDASRAKEILGWVPEVSFADGVQRVVQWYKETQMR